MSSYDAEAMALNEGVQAAYVIKTHLLQIMNWEPEMIEVEAFIDCNDVYKACNVANKPYKKGDDLASIDVGAGLSQQAP